MNAAGIEEKLPRIKAAWAKRGFSFESWTDPPGQVWRDFMHEVDELVMLIEGEIEVELAGVAVRPQPGEEVLIPARTRHTVTNIGDVPSRWCFGYRVKPRKQAK
jgi:mannose-6-phosphate isomerase-like protein (cupin superfamily)